jgi:hypothetical protein
VIATIPVGVGRVLIVASVPVEPGSAADGSWVGDEEVGATDVERGGCKVLAIVDGERVAWKPVRTQPIRAGQELVVVATRSGLAWIVQRTESTPSLVAPATNGNVALTLELPVLGRVDVPTLDEAARRLRTVIRLP